MLLNPDALAAAAADTLSAEEAVAYLKTVGLRHTWRAGAGDALGETQAGSPGPSARAEGPRTIDLRALPAIPISEAGAPPEADLLVSRVLGEGGMGVVQLAQQRSLQREVAIKRLRGDAASAANAEALLREAVFTGFLEHPNIAPVHALGRDADGNPVLVMKRIEGTTLATLLHDRGHPGWRRAEGDRTGLLLRALRGVCDALAYAHARGVLHRDIKPENVMLGPFGEVYLLDWGVAVRRSDRLSDGAIVGTPVYMAPEMLRPGSEPLDERTDVYLVGATLHECLAGEPPHSGRAIGEVFLSVARSTPRSYPGDVPEELADIARRAMQADRGLRFESVEALGRALAEFERHRAAADIARAAVERRVELEGAIARGEGPAAVDPLFHECRFGFEQSLRAWPENTRAHVDLQHALVLMAGYHLQQRNRASAASLLAMIDEPPPALARQLAALDAELDADREEREHLRRLAHELDPSVAERERRIASYSAAVMLGLFALGLTGGYMLGMFTPTPGGMLAFMLPASLLIGLLTFRFRRELFRNRLTRQMGLTIALAVLTIGANRALGYFYRRPFADILSADALLMSAITAVAALFFHRVYLVPSALMLITAVVAPQLQTLAFLPLLVAALLSVLTVIRAPARLRAPLLDDGPTPPAPPAGR